jgi:hypothetical protein
MDTLVQGTLVQSMGTLVQGMGTLEQGMLVQS